MFKPKSRMESTWQAATQWARRHSSLPTKPAKEWMNGLSMVYTYNIRARVQTRLTADSYFLYCIRIQHMSCDK